MLGFRPLASAPLGGSRAASYSVSTLFAGVGSMSSTASHIINRTMLVEAVGTMTSFGDVSGVFQRTTEFSGAGTMSSTATRTIARTSMVAAIGSMTSTATLTSGGQTYNRTMLSVGVGLMNSTATRIPAVAIVYDFPIGRSLGSDYGLRKSKMRLRTGIRPKIRSGSYR